MTGLKQTLVKRVLCPPCTSYEKATGAVDPLCPPSPASLATWIPHWKWCHGHKDWLAWGCVEELFDWGVSHLEKLCLFIFNFNYSSTL